VSVYPPPGSLRDLATGDGEGARLYRESSHFRSAVDLIDQATREGMDPWPMVAAILKVMAQRIEVTTKALVEARMREVGPVPLLGKPRP
jgi:hypothetical protein